MKTINSMMPLSYLQVYWPKDNEWYSGTVGEYNAIEKSHTVVYDDGIIEVLDLSQEKYRLMNEKKRKAMDSVDDDNTFDKTPRMKLKKTARKIGFLLLFVYYNII